MQMKGGRCRVDVVDVVEEKSTSPKELVYTGVLLLGTEWVARKAVLCALCDSTGPEPWTELKWEQFWKKIIT